MYAKIITLFALVLSGLGGLKAVSYTTIANHWKDDNRTTERVQLHESEEGQNAKQEEAQTHEETQTHNEGEDPARQERRSEEAPADEPLLGCHTEDATVNAEVEAFANQLGVSYESVLAWYCTGYSFETIQVAYDMSVMAGVSMDHIYEMRVVQGLTWEQVIQTLGIDFSRESLPTIMDGPIIFDEPERGEDE